MCCICNNPCLLGSFHACCSYSLMLTALNYVILRTQISSDVRELMTNTDMYAVQQARQSDFNE